MDVRIVLALILAALLVWLAGGALKPSSPAPSAAPQITAIDFPEEIRADGEEVMGTVEFIDPDGDIVEARFEVVEAVLFEPFHFDPQVEGQKKGRFTFVIFSFVPQKVTLRVVLIDRQGHRSPPVEFSFQAVGDFFSGSGESP